MPQSDLEPELKMKLLSIFSGIDDTCRKVGSQLQLDAAGEVYFYDPENGPYKFQTLGLSRRVEMITAIRDGWTPCGFIVIQQRSGIRELHTGTYSWTKNDEPCTRYVAERINEHTKRAAPPE